MPDLTPAQELREAAKRLREDASWPSEDLALAVAEWLEVEAPWADAMANTPETQAALKVARIILGTAAVDD